MHGNGSMTDYRISEQTWLTEKMAPLGPGKVTARIEDYLDLMATSTRDSELYQVANYGIAGQYDVHIDQVMMSNDASSRMQKREVFNIYAGDRLATVSPTSQICPIL